MIKLRSELHNPTYTYPIAHQHKICLIGSCFTEHIALKFTQLKFETRSNPYGILFNPLSVAKALQEIIDNKIYVPEDLFFYNYLWNSWQHHSDFSNTKAEESLKKINSAIADAHQYLQTAQYLIITLGSAWVYFLNDIAPLNEKKFAGNNHKTPTKWFTKKLLSSEIIEQEISIVLDKILAFNPDLNIIFTISPVRHLREGFIENNRSKAALITATHRLVEKYTKANYFPAYELVIDDLRDYRFYAEDLVHPTYLATQYVWEKFSDAYFSEETKKINRAINDINLGFQHKPMHPETLLHKKFLQQYYEKTNLLQQIYPFLNWSKELAYFSNFI